MAKPNAFLAKRDAAKESEHRQRLQCLSEISIMAMILAAHEELHVGPGRASFLLAEYVSQKMGIARTLLDDVGDSKRKHGDGDAEFLHTRKLLACRLQDIFGREKWEAECKEFFPMLRMFWDWEEAHR